MMGSRRSRRQLPTQRSATPFCQGLSNEVRRGFTLRGRTAAGDLQSILGITIKDDEPRGGSKWKYFSQLLDDPRACRMLCDIEVQDTPTVVTDDEKAIEQAEGDRRNSEEVHRGNRFTVIAEKGKPAPGRLRISLAAPVSSNEIVRSETSKPSMRSSPWMRGAPHAWSSQRPFGRSIPESPS